MEDEPSPKRCRLPIAKVEFESAMACGTSSDEDVGEGRSFHRSPIRKITLKRKIVQRPAINNADGPVPSAVLGCPSSSMEQQQQQFEESAILWAIDEHGLQHLNNAQAVQPSSPSASSEASEASSMSDCSVSPPPPPVERTSDYNSSSDNDSEHEDFMEAAVAAAIQKQGLLPHSVEMSPNR